MEGVTVLGSDAGDIPIHAEEFQQAPAGMAKEDAGGFLRLHRLQHVVQERPQGHYDVSIGFARREETDACDAFIERLVQTVGPFENLGRDEMPRIPATSAASVPTRM